MKNAKSENSPSADPESGVSGVTAVPQGAHKAQESAKLSSREKVRKALAHESGPIPMDFGSSPVSGIHVSVVAALREHFGLPSEPVRVIEPGQMLGEVTDSLRDAMGLDVIGAWSRISSYGFTFEGAWREWRTPWNQVVLVPDGFQTTTKSNGDVFIYPQGDRTAPVSAHMPATGYFFDTIVRQGPIDEDNLNPEDNMEEYKPLSDADLAYWQSRIPALRVSQRGVLVNIGGTSFGDVARVLAPQLRYPKGIRDVAEWYISIATRRDYIHAIFSKQCDIAIGNLERFHAIAGDALDILYICGTDFGTQASQFCSAATFDELFLPYYKRVNDWIHSHTSWKTFKHTCGSVGPLLPSLIRAGFDIMNPVQCSAAGMDPSHLKEAYGRDLVFWGGGVDTQHTLPFGTPEQVHAETLERCKIFGRNGGFVFNSIHNVQAQTPTANVLAMLKAVHTFNTAGA